MMSRVAGSARMILEVAAGHALQVGDRWVLARCVQLAAGPEGPTLSGELGRLQDAMGGRGPVSGAALPDRLWHLLVPWWAASHPRQTLAEARRRPGGDASLGWILAALDPRGAVAAGSVPVGDRPTAVEEVFDPVWVAEARARLAWSTGAPPVLAEGLAGATGPQVAAAVAAAAVGQGALEVLDRGSTTHSWEDLELAGQLAIDRLPGSQRRRLAARAHVAGPMVDTAHWTALAARAAVVGPTGPDWETLCLRVSDELDGDRRWRAGLPLLRAAMHCGALETVARHLSDWELAPHEVAEALLIEGRRAGAAAPFTTRFIEQAVEAGADPDGAPPAWWPDSTDSATLRVHLAAVLDLFEAGPVTDLACHPRRLWGVPPDLKD